MSIPIQNNLQHFGLVSIILHWLMALLVIIVFVLGWYMVELDYYDPWYTRAPDWHKALGILIFALLLFRMYWRFNNKPPAPLASYSLWERRLGRLVHILMYLLMVLLSVSGYFIATAKGAAIDLLGWLSLPAMFKLDVETAEFIELIHYYVAYGMIIIVLLHTLAAFKHHFIDRDITLKRILGIQQKED